MQPMILLVGQAGSGPIVESLVIRGEFRFAGFKVQQNAIEQYLPTIHELCGEAAPLGDAPLSELCRQLNNLAERFNLSLVVLPASPSNEMRDLANAAQKVSIPVVQLTHVIPRGIDEADWQLADALIAPGEFAKSRLLECGCPENRIAVAGCWLFSSPIVRAETAAKNRRTGEPIRVLFCPEYDERITDWQMLNDKALKDLNEALTSASLKDYQFALDISEPITHSEQAHLESQRLAIKVKSSGLASAIAAANTAKAIQDADIVVCMETEEGAVALAQGCSVVSLSYLAPEQIYNEYDGVSKVHSKQLLLETFHKLLADENYLLIQRQRRTVFLPRYLKDSGLALGATNVAAICADMAKLHWKKQPLSKKAGFYFRSLFSGKDVTIQ